MILLSNGRNTFVGRGISLFQIDHSQKDFHRMGAARDSVLLQVPPRHFSRQALRTTKLRGSLIMWRRGSGAGAPGRSALIVSYFFVFIVVSIFFVAAVVVVVLAALRTKRPRSKADRIELMSGRSRIGQPDFWSLRLARSASGLSVLHNGSCGRPTGSRHCIGQVGGENFPSNGR